MRARVSALLALLSAAAACTQDGTDRALVTSLQILAVRAEPAEIAPGGGATLDALVADPTGAGRVLEYAWGLCTPDPAVGATSCTEPGRTVPLALGTSAVLTASANLLDGLPPEVQEQGIDLFAVLTVHGPEVPGEEPEATEPSFKRVRVSTAAVKNTNPAIESFDVGGSLGGVVPVAAGAEVDLVLTPTLASLETFETTVGPEVEEMRITWLMSAGRMENGVSFGDLATGVAQTLWTAEDDAPPATLWVVLRDPRGGIAWTSREVVAAP